jgi:hypothetical protein
MQRTCHDDPSDIVMVGYRATSPPGTQGIAHALILVVIALLRLVDMRRRGRLESISFDDSGNSFDNQEVILDLHYNEKTMRV